MAHNLEERNGVYSFVSNVGSERKDVPWHGLGQEYNRPMTVNEAIAGCNADFTVRKDGLLRATMEEIEAIKRGEPLQRNFTPNDIVQTHACTVRTDLNNVLGVVGIDYGVVQNRTGFEFIDIMTSGKFGNGDTPTIETAGVLGCGEKIFISAKMPEPIKIRDTDDVIDDYVLFTTSHDGSGAVTAMFTPIRVVCNNTLNMAMNDCKNKVTFRHSKHVGNILDFTNKKNQEMALQVMNLHKHYKQNFVGMIDLLSRKKVTDAQMNKEIAKVFLNTMQLKKLEANNFNMEGVDEISTRTTNIINEVRESVYAGVGQNKWKGTALWVLNGITTYYGNEKKYRSGREQRLNSIIEGDANKKMQTLVDNLLVLE